MQVILDFLRGFLNTVRINCASMLYRHPYRTSAEGLRADWISIGRDIESVMGKLEKSARDE